MHYNRCGKGIFFNMVPLSCPAGLQLVIAKCIVLAVSDFLFSLASCQCEKTIWVSEATKEGAEGGKQFSAKAGMGRSSPRRGSSEKK